jgi:RNA polymerase sigma-70 factor (ECF subfamily)
LDREEKNALVATLVAQHDGKLRRFIEARLRHAVADVPDLMQEVFLRLIRIRHPEAIRTPEAYLYTVAKAVLHQHRARQAAVPQALDIADVLAELEEGRETGPEAQLYAEQRLSELRLALSQLPRKAYVTLILNRVVGMPLDQIGEHLGVSRPMAKKYLARALAHCRQHDLETG